MKTIEIGRTRDKELEARIVTTAMNTPAGCLVTTIVRYSSSIATTSEFIPGYNYVEGYGDFMKLETWDDAVREEGQKVIDKIKGVFE